MISTWFIIHAISLTTKRGRGNREQHKDYIHNINVVYYSCNKCNYEAKMLSTQKHHKAHVHDVDNLYYPCNKCNYEAKRLSTLENHKASIHGIV